MKNLTTTHRHPHLRLLPLLLAGLLTSGTVLADPPGRNDGARASRAGAPMERSHDQQGHYEGEGRPQQREFVYFTDQHRAAVHDYYYRQFHGKRCPPGLAKKRNGCLPPGQAKKWRVGQPLPHDVRYYGVPDSVVVRLGQPPEGHRYVRVASDILLITIGASMVVDALEDLGR